MILRSSSPNVRFIIHIKYWCCDKKWFCSRTQKSIQKKKIVTLEGLQLETKHFYKIEGCLSIC